MSVYTIDGALPSVTDNTDFKTELKKLPAPPEAETPTVSTTGTAAAFVPPAADAAKTHRLLHPRAQDAKAEEETAHQNEIPTVTVEKLHRQGYGFSPKPELVGPQDLPPHLKLQQEKQDCARAESRVMHTLGYAGTVLVIGGIGLGGASAAMFAKKGLAEAGQKALNPLLEMTDLTEGDKPDFARLKRAAAYIPGKVGDKVEGVIERSETKIGDKKSDLYKIVGEAHHELEKIDAKLAKAADINEGLGKAFVILGAVSLVTGAVLLIRRQGQKHYFDQADRCSEAGLELKAYKQKTRKTRREARQEARRIRPDLSPLPTGVSFSVSGRF